MSDTLPMHERRPATISAQLQDRFVWHTATIPQGYDYHGQAVYRFDYHTSAQILGQLAAGCGRPLTVLDVGTGNGRFIVASSPHRVFGVSGHDYRKLPQYGLFLSRDDPRYIVGNAEFLDHVLAPTEVPQKVDVVLSHLALQWMWDPLAALEQMANRVQKYGALAISKFLYVRRFAPHQAPHAQAIVRHLETAGFCVDAASQPALQKATSGTMPSITLYRDSAQQPVRFHDLAYERTPNGGWNYTTTTNAPAPES